jgi:CheY-like chemotaxis protein
VRGDPTRLGQVFENLVTNALKFTPPGGRVAVTLERVNGEARVTVTDTGIGIPEDALPHVFEQFQQADTSITRRYGGLGLGLAIARHLVELHGGRIEAESAGAEQGATFRVSLPVCSEAASGRHEHRAARAALPTLEHVRVLVVDDVPQDRDLLTTLLGQCGAEVSSAASVREALERARAHPPDVLVTDIAMPEEDGYALVRRLRGMEREGGGRIGTVAVTALASREDRARSLAEGFDLHLTKPVDPAELVEAVSRLAA